MTKTEREVLEQTEKDIKNNPLQDEETFDVNTLLDLDIEIASIKKILVLKEEHQKEKYAELNTNQNYIYNLIKLKNNIITNANLFSSQKTT